MKKTVFILFILRVIRLSITIVTLPLTAFFFGISFERDAWILSLTFITTIGLSLWGPLDETFRTKFIFLKETEGTEKALSRTASLFGFSVIISIIVITFMFVFIEPITQMLDFSGTPVKRSLITNLIVFLLPTILINQIISIGTSVLNSFEIFYIPELIGTLSSFINLILIFLLAPIIGIYSLLISQYISILLLLFAIIFHLNKLSLIEYKIPRVKWNDVRIFLIFSLPFFLPYFAGQINQFLEKWIASSVGDGKVSILDYSRQFSVMLQIVVSSVLTTVMVPLLSISFAKNELSNFAKIVKENIQIIFTILCLTLPIFIGSSDTFTHFFFNNGKLKSYELIEISELIRYYGFAFIGISLYVFFGLILITSNKSKVYAFFGVLAQTIVLSLNLIFIKSIGIYIFPISLGVGHFIVSIIFAFILKLNNKKNCMLEIVKYITFIILLSYIIYFFNLIKISNNIALQLIYNVLVLLISFSILFFIVEIKTFDNLKKYYFNKFINLLKKNNG